MTLPVGQPQKILFCIDSMACGGTELQLQGLIQRLDRSRFTPLLCTIRPSAAEFDPEDCESLALQVPRLVSPRGIWSIVQLAWWLRKNKVGIVHTFFQDATVFGGVAAWLARTPCRVASFRDMGFWAGGPEAFLTKRVYSLMTGFLANAEAVKEHFVTQFGVQADLVTVVPNGIEVSNMGWMDHEGPTANVVIVGNLNRRVKRADLFIEAAALVALQHPEVRWHVIGDGQYRQELGDLAADRGLTGKIIFAGRVDDVPSYLEKMQVAVLCSDSEGFSNALLEYMLVGCAVVATDVGGNPEAVIHGETGLLMPANDHQALAQAILNLVENTTLRRSLASEARAYVEARFAWSNCVDAHEKYYDNCC